MRKNMKQGIRYGGKKIMPPQGIFEMADRLAGDYFHKQARWGDMPINKVLGTIYLMGFMHAFEAMDVAEKKTTK